MRAFIGNLLLAVLAFATSIAQIQTDFFGMHINKQSTPWPSPTPFGILRLWDTHTGWGDTQKGPNTYDWGDLDFRVEQARTHGVDIILTIGKTPRFISSNPDDQNCAYYPGACDPPSDLESDGSGSNQTFRNFITALMAHVGPGKIKYFEIWNEPNVGGMWNNKVGRRAQLIRMAKDARTIIKTIDPKALFLTPPVANAIVATQAGRWWHNYLKEGGGEHADGMAVHGYISRNSRCPEHCPVPEEVIQLIDNVRAARDNNRLYDKPLFITEGSWGSRANVTDSNIQQAFLARYFIIAASMQVASLEWYGWDLHDTRLWSSVRTAQCSVPRDNGFVCPAGMAFEQVFKWLLGGTFIRPCSAADNIWTCDISKDNGKYHGRLVWYSDGTYGRAKTYRAGSQYVTAHDLNGNSSVLKRGVILIGDKPLLLDMGDSERSAKRVRR